VTYHLVWCPKYRGRVLFGSVAERLGQLIHSKVEALRGEIVALEIQPDHVHLFASLPPTLTVPQILHWLKGYTSYVLRREFPQLRNRYSGLWTRSYHVSTAGDVSAQTIRRHVEAQKGR
jgi:putative transposase